MEARATGRGYDMIHLADELLSRWERSARAQTGAEDNTFEAGSEGDCLPCLLKGWEPDFDD